MAICGWGSRGGEEAGGVPPDKSEQSAFKRGGSLQLVGAG